MIRSEFCALPQSLHVWCIWGYTELREIHNFYGYKQLEKFIMAEFVQQSVEEMLPELEQMERVKLFSAKEVR